MVLTLNLKTDLLNQKTRPVVMAPQHDGGCRVLALELYAGADPWPVPEGAAVRLYYARPDGSGGSYDALEDGTAAWSVSGNVLTVALVPQLFAAAGNVAVKVEFLLAGKSLHTYGFWIQVVHDSTQAAMTGDDYINWSLWTNQELERRVSELLASGDFVGPQGEQGPQGEPGLPGEKGDTGATGPRGDAGSVPPFARTVAECSDTSQMYLLPDGYLYVSREADTVQTVTEDVATEDNPILDDVRLGSDGSNATGYAGLVTTPYIDLTKYPFPFTLHLEGANFVPLADTANVRIMTYNAGKAKLSGGAARYGELDSYVNVADGNVHRNEDGSASLTFTAPATTLPGDPVTYLRFSGLGEAADVRVYVTYESRVSGVQWVSTGMKYGPTLTAAEKAEIAALAAALVDVQLLSVIGDGAVQL